MPPKGMLLALFVCTATGYQGEPQIINVSAIQCTQLADSSGPWTLGRNVGAYLDSCVQWRGTINSKRDADSEGVKEWVIPIDSNIAYSGSSILTLALYGTSGVDPLSSFAQFPPYDFLCAYSPGDVEIGMAVIITGKILGWSMRPAQSQEGKPGVRLLIGVTGIRTLDMDVRLRLSRRLR